MTSKTGNRETKPKVLRTLLIVGYIAAVLLFSGLARADAKSQVAKCRPLDEVSSILGLN